MISSMLGQAPSDLLVFTVMISSLEVRIFRPIMRQKIPGLFPIRSFINILETGMQQISQQICIRNELIMRFVSAIAGDNNSQRN